MLYILMRSSCPDIETSDVILRAKAPKLWSESESLSHDSFKRFLFPTHMSRQNGWESGYFLICNQATHAHSLRSYCTRRSQFFCAPKFSLWGNTRNIWTPCSLIPFAQGALWFKLFAYRVIWSEFPSTLLVSEVVSCAVAFCFNKQIQNTCWNRAEPKKFVD